jgi:Tetratricopeptide repeat
MRLRSMLMVVQAAFLGPAVACAQGLFGLMPPRPSDIPVAPSRENAPERRSGFRLYYAPERGANAPRSSASVRKSFLGSSSSLASRVTFFYFAPITTATPQPIVIIPEPGRPRDEEPNVERIPPPSRPEVERAVMPDAIAPGAPASVFRPIRPEDRARAMVPAMAAEKEAQSAAQPTSPEREKTPAPVREPPPLPGPPAEAAESKMASAQLLEAGKEAFQAQQYSRAERSFRRAVEVFAHDSGAYFLLAQAQFALGKYAEAVAAIHAGMRLQPDRPNAPFRVRDVYGADSGNFSDQLRRLADALAHNPDDYFLIFLYAYQLWFDNRKDEARLLFQRARALAPDPSFSDRFLQAKVDAPI